MCDGKEIKMMKAIIRKVSCVRKACVADEPIWREALDQLMDEYDKYKEYKKNRNKPVKLTLKDW